MENIFARMWENLIGRMGGPLTFRLIHTADGRSLLCGSRRLDATPSKDGDFTAGRLSRIRLTGENCFERAGKTSPRSLLSRWSIDVIYQIRELAVVVILEEALIVAAKLALFPYILLRGLTNRVLRRLLKRAENCDEGYTTQTFLQRRAMKQGDTRVRETEHSTLTLDISTRLAFDRTCVAYERTMLAWIRTATSLITFGFAVYKFFQLEVPSSRAENRLIGPREFGLSLVIMGLVSLLLATIEHCQAYQTCSERNMRAINGHWRCCSQR